MRALASAAPAVVLLLVGGCLISSFSSSAEAFIFPSSSSSAAALGRRRTAATATGQIGQFSTSTRTRLASSNSGWNDDEDVRFMSPKHIDTGFLKVSRGCRDVHLENVMLIYIYALCESRNIYIILYSCNIRTFIECNHLWGYIRSTYVKQYLRTIILMQDNVTCT